MPAALGLLWAAPELTSHLEAIVANLGVNLGGLTYLAVVDTVLFSWLETLGQRWVPADDVVKNPHQTLQWLCDYMRITFDEKMLSWELDLKNSTLLNVRSLVKNPDSEPWYETVRTSQTFLP